MVPTSMTLNEQSLFCVISPNSIALEADYVTVVEDNVCRMSSSTFCHPAARSLCDSWARPTCDSDGHFVSTKTNQNRFHRARSWDQNILSVLLWPELCSDPAGRVQRARGPIAEYLLRGGRKGKVRERSRKRDREEDVQRLLTSCVPPLNHSSIATSLMTRRHIHLHVIIV